MSETASRLSRTIYEETKALYERVAEDMGCHALGYRILYGPPIEGAKILFLGHQPGGASQTAGAFCPGGEHLVWPETSDYACASWRLAKCLQSIWPKELLAECTGTNINFFRAPSIARWRSLKSDVRRELESFSRSRCEALVRALGPERIIVIGMATFDSIADGSPCLVGDKNRVLARAGQLWDVPAIGVVHLSGARISRVDRMRLTAFLNPARSC
ncbi:hypothetical protein [Ancylobacter terrae]|uniref:hypothetical protein n=1 Tax=Ancylobacter sp. sgz301288 TaxID=3342077 RepID=UPI00385B1E78